MITSKRTNPAAWVRVFVAGGLVLGGLALEGGLMVRQALWLRALGPICGHRGLFLTVHCPGCYLAAAMVLCGLAILTTVALEPRRLKAG